MLPPTSSFYTIDVWSDFFIAMAYYAIPLQIVYFLKYYPSTIQRKHYVVLLLFAFFILLCGSTHLVSMLHYSWWTSWESVLIFTKVMTAIVSLTTMSLLFFIIPDGLRYILYTRDLEIEVQKKLIQLDEANRVALQANLNKDEFMAFLCHEIRNPLHIITANIDFLFESKLSAEQLHYIHSVNDSAELMVNIVNDVLDISRLQAGRMSFEKIPTDIESICQTVILNTNRQATAKGLTLKCSFSPEAPKYVISDPTRIHQILLNLLSNAIKFTRSGGEVSVSVYNTDTFPYQNRRNSSVSILSHDLKSSDLKTSSETKLISEPLRSRRKSKSASFDSNDLSTTGLLEACVCESDTDEDASHRIDVGHANSYSETSSSTTSKSSIEISGVNLQKALRTESSSDSNDYENDSRPHQYVCFDVRDSGAGIPSHVLPQLFAPYTQAKLSTVRKHGGTGLGLSICNQIVKNMGGHIGVRSEVGKGSTFSVVFDFQLSTKQEVELLRSHRNGSRPSDIIQGIALPNGSVIPEDIVARDGSRQKNLHDPNALPSAFLFPPSSISSTPPMPTRDLSNPDGSTPDGSNEIEVLNKESDRQIILVTDDNRVNQKILSRILIGLNYRVIVANDGLEAVRAVEEYPTIACIFMDISMPIMDGYEATRQLRAAGHTMLIIALTANALSEERKKATLAGMDEFATKPIRKHQIMKFLEHFKS